MSVDVKFKAGSNSPSATIDNGTFYAATGEKSLYIDIKNQRIKLQELIGTQTAGQNIKTINGNTLLGSGDLELGGRFVVDTVNVSTSWTYDSTTQCYTQNVYLEGLTSEDTPWVDVNLTGTKTNMEAQLTEYAKILKIETTANYLVLYAGTQTTSQISLSVKRSL